MSVVRGTNFETISGTSGEYPGFRGSIWDFGEDLGLRENIWNLDGISGTSRADLEPRGNICNFTGISGISREDLRLNGLSQVYWNRSYFKPPCQLDLLVSRVKGLTP